MAGLVLEAGKRVRKIRPSHRSWTPAKQRAFLEALAECCNVKLAAKKAGVSTSMAYVRRGRDASFRTGWDKALAAGYAQLEMMLLERALHGVERTVIARDGTRTVMREYSDRVALALLLHGNAYTRLVTDSHDQPAELHLMRPERVSVVSGADGWASAYLYRAGGQAGYCDWTDRTGHLRTAGDGRRARRHGEDPYRRVK